MDAHHIRHWADGGETKLDNLVLLCRHHHSLVHEGGYRIEREEGRSFTFISPSGYRLQNNVDDLTRGSCATLLQNVSAETRAHDLPAITAGTCISTWDGKRPDYDHILWCMTNFMQR